MDLYAEVVRQARTPAFYTTFMVPDTPDGRYDMIMVHAFLLLQRLKQDHEQTKDLGQAFFDLMFDDFDQNLREMGAGDIGVSHRIKDMAKAFYGRIAAYQAGIQSTDDTLLEALERNVYRNAEAELDKVAALAQYMRDQSGDLAGQSTEDLLAGRLRFTGPTATPEPSG